MHDYSIVVHEEDELSFLEYVKEQKIAGYIHPNMPGGALFKLKLDDGTATYLPLKFRLKVFGKSDSEIVIQI